MGNGGKRSRRQTRSDCRTGRHRYGVETVIGGGIVRRMCKACGTVSIDLTSSNHSWDLGELATSSIRRPSQES